MNASVELFQHGAPRRTIRREAWPHIRVEKMRFGLVPFVGRRDNRFARNGFLNAARNTMLEKLQGCVESIRRVVEDMAGGGAGRAQSERRREHSIRAQV